jgi:hypothetical protein
MKLWMQNPCTIETHDNESRIMRSKVIIILVIMLLFTSVFPAMAHDGEIHASDIEVVVSGIGIILIGLSVASLFIKQKDDDDDTEETTHK